VSRFIWQFELTGRQWLPQGNWQKDSHKWEIRYFWPIDQIVELNLNEQQLNWDQGECKLQRDVYWLDVNNPTNIKQRRDQLVYKPVVQQHHNRTAFDKKQRLDPDELSQSNFKTIEVEKMALQLKIHQKPKCMLELSKIQLQNQTFSSLCIESRCGELLDNIDDHLQLSGKACDYITFLRGIK